MEKRKTFLVFAIAMIVILFTCSVAFGQNKTVPQRTPMTDEVAQNKTILEDTQQSWMKKNYTGTIETRLWEPDAKQITTPRKIPICVKRDKTELRPLGVVDDVLYLGINDDNELMFASMRMTKNAECCCIVGLPYIQGQNYYLSAITVFKNVIVEETTEILYYN